MGHALPLSSLSPVLPARTRTRPFGASASLFPGSEWVQLLRQVYYPQHAQLETLAELKALLLAPATPLDAALTVAYAVLYRLLCRLETTFSGCLQWSLNEQSFEALLRTVAPGQIEALFAYGLARQEDELKSETQTGLSAGLAGSGSLLAVMLALHHQQGQNSLSHLIQPEGDGFLVSFPGRDPVSVSPATATEQLVFASGAGSAPLLLEKAAAALCLEAHLNADNGPGPLLAQALELLCGVPAELYDTALTPVSWLRQVIVESLASGQLLVAAGNQYPWLQPVSGGGLLLAEAYALIAYEPETDCVRLLRAQGQDSPRDAQGESLTVTAGEALRVPMTAIATYFGHLGLAALTVSELT